MRFSFLVGLVLVIAFASPLFACVESEMVEVDGYYWVSVCDSSSCGGHWQYGVIGYYSSCDDAGGSGGGGTSGGGTTGTSGVTALQNTYTNNDCGPVPIAAQILDENGYDQTGMQNYFGFADWKDGASGFVLVDPPLVPAMDSMYACMGNQLPALADPGNGAGYRVPGAHGSTDPCSSHTQGESVDFSTRDSSGNHSCQLWNQLAACAHAAGLYVEPWALIKQQGVIHMHVTTHQDANDPSQYGDACANP
jgi:hypothetical protein